MFTITREELKTDEVWNKLLEALKKQHKVPEHTQNNLLKKRHIKDICEDTSHYVIIDGNTDKPMWICYETYTWIDEVGEGFSFPVRINSVTFYDNFIQYETERLKGSHKAGPTGSAGVNFN